MDISNFLSQVESPFTDAEIINLIKKFIECNCDMNQFYRNINIEMEKKENPYLTELYNKLFSSSNRGNRFVDINNFWNIVGSSEETLSVPNNREKRVPIYRIYLNAKGKDKAIIIEEYIRQCESRGQQYKLKYSVEDGRDDEILILSYGEDLTINIELVEGIIEGMNLGEPAPLTGKYKNKIGIGEEYIQAPIYSYTKTRLGMISIIMKKFYLDHLEDFSEFIDDEYKKIAQININHFKEESEDIELDIEEKQKDVKLQENNVKLEELRNRQIAYSNNIDPNIGWMNDYITLYSPEIMKKYMDEHFETAIPEMIGNYHLACEIFGISKNGVFSKITEKMMEKKIQTPLQKREKELSDLEIEAKGYAEAEALLSKLQQKEEQDIGEQ